MNEIKGLGNLLPLELIRNGRTAAKENPEVSRQDKTMPLNDGEISGLSKVGG